MGDLLTAYNGSTITYDQIGNPLNDGTWTYAWKQGRHPCNKIASQNPRHFSKWRGLLFEGRTFN